jgi:hypothetical protein
MNHSKQKTLALAAGNVHCPRPDNASMVSWRVMSGMNFFKTPWRASKSGIRSGG